MTHRLDPLKLRLYPVSRVHPDSEYYQEVFDGDFFIQDDDDPDNFSLFACNDVMQFMPGIKYDEINHVLLTVKTRTPSNPVLWVPALYQYRSTIDHRIIFPINPEIDDIDMECTYSTLDDMLMAFAGYDPYDERSRRAFFYEVEELPFWVKLTPILKLKESE